IARVANPLVLVAQQQPIYHPQTHPTHYNQNFSTKSQQAATRNRGKAIVNSPQPIYDQEPSMVDDDDETSKDKEIDKLMALISLSIGKSNVRLRSDLKSKESTLQAVYDVLKLTPFYKAFLVTTDVLAVYMQEFWAIATVHHHLICFKMNNKKDIVNLKELGHSGEIKMITNKNVDFAYLPCEEFMYQVEHNDAKKSNEMYYPRFTKVIINFFMTKDQSILRRNKVNWHFTRDDHMFTMIKLVSKHQNTQQYGAILPIELTNEAIRNSKSYKEYYAIASGAEPPRTKQASGRSKMKLAIKRSLTQTHISHASRSGADEGTGIIPEVPDVPTYESDNVKISWKSSEDDDEVKISEHDDDVDDQSDDDDDDEQTDSDNDGDDFVHPKFSTHDEEDKDKESFDPIVQTPSQVENTDDEDNDEDSHGMNVEGDKEANEEDDAADLSKLELKKILINKMESNKSIHRSDEQKNLYKALVDAYECDKLILDPYGDTITLKRRQDDEDKAKNPLLDQTGGPREDEREKNQSQLTASESTPIEEPMHTTQDLEELAHQEFETSATDDQHVEEASQHPHWF
nr:hypothetical protein [Tanacetum cinerariifolium]